MEVLDKEQTTLADVTANQNYQAAHSLMVMEQWANGEIYDEATWIERGRHAVRQTMEGMFELGRALIVLKEHTERGRFMEIVKREFGIGHNETARLMAATQRFATPQMQKAAPKLMDLGKSKLLELLVEEDVTLIGLAEGGEVNGMTLDDVDRMTVRELRVALRENREDAQAKDKVLADKNAKIDELAEKLEKAKKKGGVKEPNPADVASELHMAVGAKEVAIRSQLAQLGDYFAQMAAHEAAHGLSHRARMAGALNQIIMDCQHLRDQYALPESADDDGVPEWLQPESE
ncbi:DUF3102 domain-containing protein [Kingella oralis]|jgi:hypothetical protein|uniref:DUF3102 domain-containing protein n=1 Tax=Kingella oralis TaxID=505 RepID=UPI00206F1DCF|nr:DUF3102 domain-containing protein [Kingella oralis]DAK04662.1 MAG TPA: Protein of unknown function (DUF3102) [Caudoviricetes sp.]